MSITTVTSAASEIGTVAPPGQPPQAHVLRAMPLRPGLLTLYGTGAIVDSSAGVFLGTFLYFYLTAVCGLSGTLAGGILGFTLIVDSIVDPLVGSLSDNSNSAFGRRHPFMLAAILPIVLCLGLLFSIPAALQGLALLGYVFVLTMALRVALSMFSVSYIALGSELTDDYHARSTVVAVRVALGTVGTIAMTILGYGVFLSAAAGGQLHRGGYAPFAWSGVALMAAAALLSIAGTASARNRLHQGTAGGGAAVIRLVKEMQEVFRNRSFNYLFIASLIFYIGVGVSGALALHVNTFFWKLTPSTILVLTLAGIPGLFCGLGITVLIARLVEKKALALIGLTVFTLCQFLPVPLRLVGMLPGTTAPFAALIVATFIGSVGLAVATVGCQSMMADAADEHELLFGARREGLYFAGLNFAAKASHGIGVLIAGLAADAIHFPNNLAAAGPNAAVPWEAARNLALIYGPAASLLIAIAVFLILGFRIDKAAHARILAALAARRTETSPSPIHSA